MGRYALPTPLADSIFSIFTIARRSTARRLDLDGGKALFACEQIGAWSACLKKENTTAPLSTKNNVCD